MKTVRYMVPVQVLLEVEIPTKDDHDRDKETVEDIVFHRLEAASKWFEVNGLVRLKHVTSSVGTPKRETS